MGDPPKISLKAARVNAEIPIAEAAKHIGVTYQTLISYESGRTIPSWEVVQKLCDLYEYPIGFISFTHKVN